MLKDVVIIDTAGRFGDRQSPHGRVINIKAAVPTLAEILLVVDSMIGQDAVTTAANV